MPTFSAPDGTLLAYHERGDGAPLVCLPGGPMQDCGYLGDLGGLPAYRRLILLDPRGTGGSAVPADPASYRCDRQVDDVEALRVHLGLDRIDLLGHSAGGNLAVRYLERHPDRVGRLVLVTPSPRAVGIEITGAARTAAAQLRRDEAWYPDASAALAALAAGEDSAELWQRVQPFFYGRWDAAARAHSGSIERHRNDEAIPFCVADGAFDPPATRAAIGTAGAPVLLVAGEFDLNTMPWVVAEYAALFRNAEHVVQPGAGHYPWLDDPDRFLAIVAPFLA
ncbi:MAG: alpha/beta hydrolase [Micromonosporaceae bacterium]|nr:alpha/beta hydrolase [Micromonosporaceae bacterium]